MELYGKKVKLRAMEPEDMEMLRETVNDPVMESMVGGWSFPVSRYQQMKWYEKAVFEKDSFRFIIETIDGAEVIGMISLNDINWKNRVAGKAIKIRSGAFRNKGYATDAQFTLMRFAFEELQLHRLYSEVLDYNTASIAMTEKCGAKREGCLRSAAFKGGQYHDVYCYGVLYEDYLDAAQKAGWL